MSRIFFFIPLQAAEKLAKQDFETTEWAGISNNLSCWIWTTYSYLKQAGFPCEVTHKIPQEGILIADRDSLGDCLFHFDNLMLICTKADREFHPSAHLHVVQNPYDAKYHRDSIWNPYFIPHWSQPGLIPRVKERKSQVTNVAYIGARSQLAPELKSAKWNDGLSALGCQWLPIFDFTKWNDYSHLDVIVAARSFQQAKYLNKPASKLVNCWRAGTPAILTPESAFVSVKKTELDFIEITSLDDALKAVQKLKNHSDLYNAMVKNGWERAKQFDKETITNQWINFLEQDVSSAYAKWQNTTSIMKRKLFYQRIAKLKWNRLKARINR